MNTPSAPSPTPPPSATAQPISEPKAPKVVGYIRASTDEQKNTLEAQRRVIAAYCEFSGLDLVHCFVESESAFDVSFYERPVAADMLSRMPELGATEIVITKLDRGFRNALDCLFTVDALEKRRIGLHLLDLKLDPRSPIGKLLLTMLAAIAEFENKQRSDRQKQAFAVMKSQGQRTGCVPYGWRAVPSGRTSKTGRPAQDLVPEPAEQLWLRRLVAGDWKHLSCNEAARRLNAAGVKAKQGGSWYGATVGSVRATARLADNSAYEAIAAI